MKLKSLISLVASSALIAACGKDAGPECPLWWSDVALDFVVGGAQTKATKGENGDYDIKTLVSDGFQAAAYYYGEDGSDARWLTQNGSSYQKNVVFKEHISQDIQERFRFQEDRLKYWPRTGTVDFYALYPSTHTIQLENGVTPYVIMDNTDGNDDFLVSRNCNVSAPGATASDVPLEFVHPMIFLFQISATLVAEDGSSVNPGIAANTTMTINSISIRGHSKARYTFYTDNNANVGKWGAPLEDKMQTYTLRDTKLSGMVLGTKYDNALQYKKFLIPGYNTTDNPGQFTIEVNYSIVYNGLVRSTYVRTHSCNSLDVWVGDNPSEDYPNILLAGCKNSIDMKMPLDGEDIVFSIQSESGADAGHRPFENLGGQYAEE